MKANVLLLALIALCLTGCASYEYRVLLPPTGAPAVRDQPVTVHYEPLDYRLSKYHDRLEMQISNPTDDKMTLLGNRSFVVDPQGESHPIRERVLGPHSFTRLPLPPVPFTYPYPQYWGPGWGYWGWYDPYWGPWYGPGWWGPPPVTYRQALTVYDWEWKKGTVRLQLLYERGTNTFEHEFEIVREVH